MPFDVQGCPGNDRRDPKVGDFVCEQVVAVRFPRVDIPRGAKVTSAFVSFDVDETDRGRPAAQLKPGTSVAQQQASREFRPAADLHSP